MTSPAASPAGTPAPGRPSFLPGPATARPCSIGGLLSLTYQRRGAQRVASAVTAMLLVAGTGLLAAPAITDVFAWFRQHQLHNQLATPRLKTLFRTGAVPVGDDLTQLVINNDRVKVNVVVVQGTTPAALEAGAGHYVHTPLPCSRGNVGIAGHRTTYGRPFNQLNALRAGDSIKLLTPVGRCTYRVFGGFQGHPNPWIVSPSDVGVVGQSGRLATGHWLTLTSCNPPGSATQRIVLRARMVSSSLRPAGNGRS